jgi:hypothetical protein
MKYTVTLGWIAHLALCRFRKKAKNFITRTEIPISLGSLLLIAFALSPQKVV